MFKSRSTLTLILFLSLLTPIAHGFTVDGPTNFQGPGGGNVVFSFFTAQQYSIVNGMNTFTDTVFNGVDTGVIGFDCDAGDLMNITIITPTVLSYSISGAGQQRIYFQGYGRPTEIRGGTVILGPSDSLLVNTTLTGEVVLTWRTNTEIIVNKITNYIVILGLIPLILAGALIIMMMQTGEFNLEGILFILATIVGLYVMLLVWVSITS